MRTLAAERAAPAAPWWLPRPVLREFVSDLLEGELFHLRRSGSSQRMAWRDDLLFDEDLGVDSLERLQLASALSQSLHLHESGIEDALLARRSFGDWVDVAQAGLELFSDRLTFRTSGSTGMPKPCAHELASLLQESAQHGLMFGDRTRILCAVPRHHIYGFLFGVLLPSALGLPPKQVIDVRASTPAWLAQGARPGDLVIGHPDYWAAVAQAVPALARDVIGVTSTAPCSDLVSEAVERLGLARLIQIYGSSETAGIGWRASHREPYTLFSHLRFSAEDGADLWRQLPEGQQVTVACQDQIERVGSDQFHVGARCDNAVQVGGLNVFTSHVRAVLLRHPQVQDAAVRLMRPHEGNRLKAFVVPVASVGDGVEFVSQLRRWIDRELEVAERPKAIRLGAQLPTTDSGKAADWSTTQADAPQRHW
jgi:long-chain acyl-CoA synthetase